MEKLFSLGIDLGTSNSAAACLDFESRTLRQVELTQLLGPNLAGRQPTLPSALYLPRPGEFEDGSLRLPWHDGSGPILGQLARDRGASAPDRLIVSAKSWLSNAHLDPRSAILPWGSSADSGLLSPFECSRRYLEHLRAAVQHEAEVNGRRLEWDRGQVVVTVPASFDEVARRLTAEAAAAAGFPDAVLLEEPQAAFYAWLEQIGSEWRKQIHPNDVVLVCDVGGGTTDFSLIAVSETGGNLALERICVGDHLLLGGDNMDLALAYALQAQLAEEGTELDDWQFQALVHASRIAKEALFANESLPETSVALPSRGARLLAGSVSTTLHRDLLDKVVLDGFFALTGADERPHEDGGAALQEFGLPYAADAVISKHLALFLARGLENTRSSAALSRLVDDRLIRPGATFLCPTAILFNGGVFKAAPLRRRVLDLLASWNNDQPVRELEGFQPDLSVARGAAIYGRNRCTGQGLRIKAGTARSYYIGIEVSRPAVPGYKPPVKGLCVVPQGMEEGASHVLEGRQFGLVVGKPAVFRFFSSAVRGGDQAGSVVADAEKALDETNHLEVVLPPMKEFPPGQPLPVQLESVVTELGNLELWMKHTPSAQRWKVEFQVRME